MEGSLTQILLTYFMRFFSFLSAPTNVSQSEHSDGQSRAGQGKCGTCELLSDRHRFLHLFSEQMRPILTRTQVHNKKKCDHAIFFKALKTHQTTKTVCFSNETTLLFTVHRYHSSCPRYSTVCIDMIVCLPLFLFPSVPSSLIDNHPSARPC